MRLANFPSHQAFEETPIYHLPQDGKLQCIVGLLLLLVSMETDIKDSKIICELLVKFLDAGLKVPVFSVVSSNTMVQCLRKKIEMVSCLRFFFSNTIFFIC